MFADIFNVLLFKKKLITPDRLRPLSVETIYKAADPELAAEANKRINEYKKYYPLTADAFMFGVNDGETYQVSCGGFKANTTVRTQN